LRYDALMRLKWLLSSLTLAFFLLVAHFYILENFLYWRFKWMDTPMHVLGSIVISIFVAVLVGNRHKWYIPIVLLLFTGWEIFEYCAGLPQPQVSYLIDTLHDLVNDGLGAGLIYFIARETLWRSN
jgi:hypothetical protein